MTSVYIAFFVIAIAAFATAGTLFLLIGGPRNHKNRKPPTPTFSSLSAPRPPRPDE